MTTIEKTSFQPRFKLGLQYVIKKQNIRERNGHYLVEAIFFKIEKSKFCIPIQLSRSFIKNNYLHITCWIISKVFSIFTGLRRHF